MTISGFTSPITDWLCGNEPRPQSFADISHAKAAVGLCVNSVQRGHFVKKCPGGKR